MRPSHQPLPPALRSQSQPNPRIDSSVSALKTGALSVSCAIRRASVGGQT